MIAINDKASGATVAADFIAIQTNADLSSSAQVEETTLAAIAANTPTSVASALTTIYSAQFFDAAGDEISLCFDRTAQEVESNIALTNITCSLIGV